MNLVETKELATTAVSTQPPESQLEIMLKLSAVLNSSLETSVVRERAIHAASMLVNCEACSLLLIDESTGGLYFDVALGESGDAVKRIQLKQGQGIAGWVAEKKSPVLIKDAQNDPRLYRQADKSSGFTTRNMLCLPITIRNNTIGVLQAINKKESSFSKIDAKLLSALSNQIAVALENARLYDDLRDSLHSTVYVLAHSIEKRDPHAGGHAKRVARYCMAIGKELGLSKAELVNLKLAAVLHDVGMIGTPDELLQKRERLTQFDQSQIMKHVRIGEELVKQIKQLRNIAPAIKYHHEYYNGDGFYKLRGEGIPLFARIIAVADAFDAMTSKRPYRVFMGSRKALAELREQAGGQFDPKIVDAFIKCAIDRTGKSTEE